MNLYDSTENKGDYSPLYFYRYALKDLIQEFFYIQMTEIQSINPKLNTSRQFSLPNNFWETSESFDSNIFKCYKFYL